MCPGRHATKTIPDRWISILFLKERDIIYYPSKKSPRNRMVVARGWGKGRMGSYCLMGTGFQFDKTKRVLEMDGGDDHTTT